MAEVEKISLDGVVYDISDANAVKNIQMNGSTLSKSSGTVNLGTVITDVSNKQDTLVSGTNIKTINNTSILGSGNITVATDVSGKADKVSNATNGNFAALNSSGNLTDSGKKNSDFVHIAGAETITGAKTISGDGLKIDDSYLYLSSGSSITNTLNQGDFDWIRYTVSTNPYTYVTVQDALDAKQAALVSGTNIKTINNTSLLGSGNISVVTDISGKEDTTNKVTSLSSSSTDTQYPSAKCVYDIVGDIETLINAL